MALNMEGEERIEAPIQKVWEALNDPEVLKASIPGCQSLEKKSDNELAATVVLKIGPIKATFTGEVTLSNLNPPGGYTISGEGYSMVTVRFRVGEDQERSVTRVRARLESAMDQAPPGALPPIVKPHSVDDVPVLTLTLHAKSRFNNVQSELTQPITVKVDAAPAPAK